MPRYTTPVSDLLTEETVRQLYDGCDNLIDKAIVALCWKTGGRTHEITWIKKEDITITEDRVVFRLNTEKLGESTNFILRERQLEFARKKGLDIDIYLEAIISYADTRTAGQPLFEFSDRYFQLKINRLSMKVLGKKLCPYHFRHSAITMQAKRGAGISDLMHFKGSKGMDSVKPYVHATPYVVK